MPKLVVNGATLQCNQGVAPSKLVVLPVLMGDIDSLPMATVDDHKPTVNIPPFGMCNATTNPMVISLTAAAMGVHTPAPCIPVTTSPWITGSTRAELRGKALLTQDCKLMCQWAGEITIKEGSSKAEVDR